MTAPTPRPERRSPHSGDGGYDFLVFFGRFQPFHLGHRKVVEAALRQAGHLVLLIGSASASISHLNPWNYEERREMIAGSLSAEETERVTILPLDDLYYSDTLWAQLVQKAVAEAVSARDGVPAAPRIGLIGRKSDHSRYYRRLFPQWDMIEVETLVPVTSKSLRAGLFSDEAETSRGRAGDRVPPNVGAELSRFRSGDRYRRILEELRFIRDYRKSWAGSPYEPVFVTTDAVVIQGGHVLVIERGSRPGQGLLALPGGFLGTSESLEDSMLRELREETRIKLTDPVLRASIVGPPRVFDAPDRDPRGRFITHAFLLALNPGSEDGAQLPEVEASDDAAAARWLPLAACRRAEMFLDHFDIIRIMVSQL